MLLVLRDQELDENSNQEYLGASEPFSYVLLPPNAGHSLGIFPLLNSWTCFIVNVVVDSNGTEKLCAFGLFGYNVDVFIPRYQIFTSAIQSVLARPSCNHHNPHINS